MDVHIVVQASPLPLGCQTLGHSPGHIALRLAPNVVNHLASRLTGLESLTWHDGAQTFEKQVPAGLVLFPGPVIAQHICTEVYLVVWVRQLLILYGLKQRDIVAFCPNVGYSDAADAAVCA